VNYKLKKTDEWNQDAVPNHDPTQEEQVDLQEGIDYDMEQGLLVFTATFLQKRGYCCESGCRHCPYQSKQA